MSESTLRVVAYYKTTWFDRMPMPSGGLTGNKRLDETHPTMTHVSRNSVRATASKKKKKEKKPPQQQDSFELGNKALKRKKCPCLATTLAWSKQWPGLH